MQMLFNGVLFNKLFIVNKLNLHSLFISLPVMNEFSKYGEEEE